MHGRAEGRTVRDYTVYFFFTRPNTYMPQYSTFLLLAFIVISVLARPVSLAFFASSPPSMPRSRCSPTAPPTPEA